MTEDKEMSFLDHLEELRWHLVRAVIAILIGSVVAFIFPHILFDVILFGPTYPDFITYRLLCQLGNAISLPALCFGDLPFKEFISIQMGSQFTWHIWGSLIAGFIITFPYVAWECWRFIKPALREKERSKATGIVFYVSILFIAGVLFGYFLLAPLTVNFLGNYDVMGRVVNQPVFTSYISTILVVILGCGILFELPVVIYFLAKIGIISPDFLKKYRRHAIIIILLLAAIITPPDVASQILVSIPLVFLYEVSIFIARRVYKKPAED
ncbi:MAG: twin-arginine translocase subunit TatC [Flavobacteriales bacterium]|nr:twin-arginine translocase subunit TatC [Flavobacteriales bacterium]